MRGGPKFLRLPIQLYECQQRCKHFIQVLEHVCIRNAEDTVASAAQLSRSRNVSCDFDLR